MICSKWPAPRVTVWMFANTWAAWSIGICWNRNLFRGTFGKRFISQNRYNMLVLMTSCRGLQNSMLELPWCETERLLWSCQYSSRKLGGGNPVLKTNSSWWVGYWISQNAVVLRRHRHKGAMVCMWNSPRPNFWAVQNWKILVHLETKKRRRGIDHRPNMCLFFKSNLRRNRKRLSKSYELYLKVTFRQFPRKLTQDQLPCFHWCQIQWWSKVRVFHPVLI